MNVNTGLVDIEGVVSCAAIVSHMLFSYSFRHSARLTDYCNTLNKKMVGAEQRVVHVCGDIIC